MTAILLSVGSCEKYLDDPEQTFYGLKSLLLHSQNSDPSQMHERLAYWLFREIGVAAPRSVQVRLTINGQLSGL